MIVGSVPAKVGHRQTPKNTNAPQGALVFATNKIRCLPAIARSLSIAGDLTGTSASGVRFGNEAEGSSVRREALRASVARVRCPVTGSWTEPVTWAARLGKRGPGVDRAFLHRRAVRFGQPLAFFRRLGVVHFLPQRSALVRSDALRCRRWRPGILAEERERVFGPFYRLDRSRSRGPAIPDSD